MSDDRPAAGAAVRGAADRARKRRPPLSCCDCGKRVFTSLEGFQEHYENGGHWIWHHDCRPPWQIADE